MLSQKDKEKWHKYLNSIKYQVYKNNDLDYFRELIRIYCRMKNYKGGLLDFFNKSYQLNKQGLDEYIYYKLPKKYFIEFMESI